MNGGDCTSSQLLRFKLILTYQCNFRQQQMLLKSYYKLL